MATRQLAIANPAGTPGLLSRARTSSARKCLRDTSISAAMGLFLIASWQVALAMALRPTSRRPNGAATALAGSRRSVYVASRRCRGTSGGVPLHNGSNAVARIR